MRLQVIDSAARFACHSCGACCDQPWRTAIEAVKAAALDRHDWSKYPQLVGRPLYHPAADGREGFFDLAKGEGTRCVFLGTDGLCIIHKELGPEAKPAMCRQFPFLSARTWVDERVSVNFGCPSAQRALGEPIQHQAAEIARLVPTSGRTEKPDARIPLTGRATLSLAESDVLIDELIRLFDERREADLWTRFTEALAFCAAATDWRSGTDHCDEAREASEPRITLTWDDRPGVGLTLPLRRADADPAQPPPFARFLRGHELVRSLDSGSVRPDPRPARAPLASRMLFAATLHPDTIPADAGGRMGLARKLTLIPKLMHVAQLSGGYASRLLGRNVSIDDVLRHEVTAIDAAGTRLLLRYYRSRFWQRMLIGTRMSIVAGLHQHILDLNAILFFARAEARRWDESVLSEQRIRDALTRVEFHLSNQPRLCEQVLKGWFRRQLDDIGVALASLRMMAMTRKDECRMTDDGRRASHGRATPSVLPHS